MPSDYIGDLKDFQDYDFDIYNYDEFSCVPYKWKWGKATSEEYDQFIKDKWGDYEYNIDWFNVCFGYYSTVCDDHLEQNFNNSTMYSRECKEYSAMAILNKACLSNRMDIIYYITEIIYTHL